MAEYDAITREYRESKRLLFREHVERYTLFERLGDIRGTMFSADGEQFGFDNYYLAAESHAAAFERAGFRGFRWVDMALRPSEARQPVLGRVHGQPADRRIRGGALMHADISRADKVTVQKTRHHLAH